MHFHPEEYSAGLLIYTQMVPARSRGSLSEQPLAIA